MFDATIDNEYEDLPDPEHVSTMFDAAIDTVSGNEGISYAQHYAHGVLGASGSLTGRTGVEGFFESVGNGLKAVWDYIVKVFKSIWNFFFGKGEKTSRAATARVKEKAEVAIEGLKEAKEVPKTAEEGNAKITKMKEKIKRTVSDPKTPSAEKHTAEEVIHQLEEAKDKPPTEQGRVIKSSMDALARLEFKRGNLQSQADHLDKIYDDWEEKVKKSIESVNWESTAVGKEYKAFATSIRSHFPEMRKKSISLFPKTLNGIDDAIKALEALADSNKEWGQDGSIGKLTTDYVKKLEGTVNKLEHDLEAKKDDKSLVEELKVTKEVLSLANNLSTIAYKEADFSYSLATSLDLGFKKSERK